MIWLQRPPWAKWLAVGALVAFALWIEVRPEPTVDHPFAAVDIAAGDEVNGENTEMRPVPVGLFEAPDTNSRALIDIPAGAPILTATVGPEDAMVPSGWWVVSMEVPTGSRVGDRVKVVLVDQARDVSGVISAIGEWDGLAMSLGGVAVPPEVAADVAVAAAEGRLSLLVAAG